MDKGKPDRSLTGQRLVAVFLLGLVLFNYPILSLFNRQGAVLGIPILYAWLFGVWIGLIAIMAWVVEHRRE